MTQQKFELFPAGSFDAESQATETLALANDADPRDAHLAGVTTVLLNFPSFSDGRAFSQAFLLRRRLSFAGEIRATGDVLIDQLQQMQRSGFTQAVLRADQNLAAGERQLARYPAFYQGDAVTPQPHFIAALA
jgi:uncharacterized protein (DUF934 family)